MLASLLQWLKLHHKRYNKQDKWLLPELVNYMNNSNWSIMNKKKLDLNVVKIHELVKHPFSQHLIKWIWKMCNGNENCMTWQMFVP